VDLNDISSAIIGAAVEVHRALGPGLLESIYEEALVVELSSRTLPFKRRVEVPLTYKGTLLNSRLRMDLLVADAIIVEVKSVEAILKIHEAQLLSYLRLADRRLGLLINFNVSRLLGGVRRIANHL
jgi:GxxExxY protein